MCIGADLAQGELACRHSNPAGNPAALDLHPENILAHRHVANSEVLMVDGDGMVARSGGFDERERSLLRLRFNEAVDACLQDWLSVGVPRLPRHEPCAWARLRRHLRAG